MGESWEAGGEAGGGKVNPTFTVAFSPDGTEYRPYRAARNAWAKTR